jgi:hypothetical protein
MQHVSRPLIGLLVGTVAFFAVWLVAFKPSSSTSAAGGTSGLGRFQPAINAARGVAATTQAGAARATTGNSGTPAANSTPTTASATVAPSTKSAPSTITTPRTTTTPAATSTARTPSVRVSSSVPAARVRLNTVQRALKAHKVIALLFYNPAAADDVAVKQEMRAIPTHRGAVVKLSVPLGELSRYAAVTNQVQVQFSPTLVLIDRHANATTIVGFTDTFEIANRLDDTLAAH